MGHCRASRGGTECGARVKMRIVKPMLAAAFEPDRAVYPYIATPKIDGIRFVMVGGVALSRTFKPIRNAHIQAQLAAHLPDGVDGELTCGDTFQSSTSAVMTSAGSPRFKAWLFDYVPADCDAIPGYTERMARLAALVAAAAFPFECVGLTDGRTVHSHDDVQAAAADFLAQGYEGAMLRSPGGTYKFGRATARENILLKVKGFRDAEATVIGFVEKLRNTNEATRDGLDRSKRSSHKAGRLPAGTLGALLVKAPDGATFKIGSGFSQEQRDAIWANQAAHMGQPVKYKFFEIGVKDLPRHPTFLGFRDRDDM